MRWLDRLREPTTKPNSLSSIPMTHMVERKSTVLKVDLQTTNCDIHAHHKFINTILNEK